MEDSVVVELKSVEDLAPVHSAQLLTYLKTSHKRVGLLINFNVLVLKDGIKRVVNRYSDFALRENGSAVCALPLCLLCVFLRVSASLR